MRDTARLRQEIGKADIPLAPRTMRAQSTVPANEGAGAQPVRAAPSQPVVDAAAPRPMVTAIPTVSGAPVQPATDTEAQPALKLERQTTADNALRPSSVRIEQDRRMSETIPERSPLISRSAALNTAAEEAQTDRLTLRRIREEDGKEAFEGYSRDPKVSPYMTWKPHAALEETVEPLPQARKVAASAAAAYGSVSPQPMRTRTQASETVLQVLAEPREGRELTAERAVAPLARVEQPALTEAVRMQGQSVTVEARDQAAQTQSLQDQIMRVITRQAVLQGKLQVQLNPRELGMLDIEFTHERGGEVQVAIVAREAATRDLLDAALPRLRQSLQEAGVALGQLDVQQENAGRETRREDLPESRVAAHHHEDAANETHSESQKGDGEGLLNVYV